MPVKGYYFITDRSLSRAGTIEDVRAAVRTGVSVVQYRNKDGSSKEMFNEALELRHICRDIIFLVNDRIDVALAVGADGVHLGQDDLPFASARSLLGTGKIIGLTVHSVAEAREAAALGADYLALSPIFSTATKKDAGAPAGLTLIREVRAAVTLPLVAIGGITLANAPSVIEAGADSLCAISAVVGAADVGTAVAQFNALFKKGII